MPDLKSFDTWLTDGTPDKPPPAAVVLRQSLEPVEGADGVLFPATYAPAEDKTKFAGGYNIDTFADGSNVCLVDSVGSQANRIEPLFLTGEYAALVPKVSVKAGDETIHLLKAGHRAGDAAIRCSPLHDDLQKAFRAAQRGDAVPLAKIAPTSLVFGVWDSRDTQAKLPRLVAATVRAFNVRKLTRSAQYVPAAEYVDEKLVDDPDAPGAKKGLRDTYAEKGYVHVPASGAHGGVIADGGVRRDVTLSLAALRLLAAGAADPLPLRRYVLGLTLVAVTAPAGTYLRQGCNLTPVVGQGTSELVQTTGHREPFTVTPADALAYAKLAADAFGVGPDRADEPFEKARFRRDVGLEDEAEPTAVADAPKKPKKAAGGK